MDDFERSAFTASSCAYISRLSLSFIDSLKSLFVSIFTSFADNSKYYHFSFAGGRLLYDLNIELRYGPQWDSTNARSLMKYLISKEYHNDVHFELGNEPPYHKFSTAAFNATGERLAKDFLILKRVLGEFNEFRNCKLVGMDGETPRDGTYTGDSAKVMKDFVKYIKHNISAITAHHYYFHGPPATLDQFYNITWFKYFETTLGLMRESLYEAAGGPVDIWIGETADSNSGGTPKITDSYASGFLWLDKLGIAAQNEIKLVARQSFYSTTSYNLLNLEFYPNPDYWLSYVFKQLVGTRVLQTSVTSQYRGLSRNATSVSNGLLRVYAHCASHRSGYPLGSITLVVVNINTGKQSACLDLNSEQFHNYNASLYLMTPEDNNLVSRNVQLNGKTLKMVDEYTLPELNTYQKPVDLNNIVFPSLSFGFVVLHPIDIQKEMNLGSVCMK